MWRNKPSEKINQSSPRQGGAFFQPTVEWNAETYARNSLPQNTLAIEIINQDNWFANFVEQSKLPTINVIDLGCGDGAITAQLARDYPKIHITGLDISKRMIENAQRNYCEPNLSFLCLDASDKALPEILDKKFDCVLSFSAIHWIDDQTQLVKNIYSIINPSAYLCLMFYTRDKHLWGAIEKTALSPPWCEYFMPYKTPYYGESVELKNLLVENGISVSYDQVSQNYPKEGRIHLRNYLSGIAPIYAPLEHALAGKTPAEIAMLRTLFLNTVIQNLTSSLIENNTFVEHEDGSSTFNYTRVVFRGVLTLDMKHHLIQRKEQQSEIRPRSLSY